MPPTEVGSAVVLDTHAMLWWQAASDRLSDSARRSIERAEVRYVSPVSFWELTMLVAKARIGLDRPTAAWVNDFLATDRVGIAELTPAVAVGAGELDGFHGDPADRMIVASALAAGLPLITKDGKIGEWSKSNPKLATIW
jgi:PIN domain nuclease of toxin-antitoxin system